MLDPEFAPYGQVLDLGDVSALADAMRALPIPENGNCYAPSDDTLMALPETERIKRSVFGDMPIQAGYCNGRGFTLNAEEYHRCSEVNFTTTGLVLLLALPEDIIDRSLDSSRVVGFYLPPDTPVEIYPRVLHFAPCRINDGGFNCLVVLTEGRTPRSTQSIPRFPVRTDCSGCGINGCSAIRTPRRHRKARSSASLGKT